MISTGVLFSSDIGVNSAEVLLRFILAAPSILEGGVIVVRIKLDRKVKSRPELFLLFVHNRLMMADFIVSSSDSCELGTCQFLLMKNMRYIYSNTVSSFKPW